MGTTDSAFFDAIQNGDMAKVQDILSDIDPLSILQDMRDRQGNSPLASAIIHGNLAVLRRLHEFAAGNREEIRPSQNEKDNLLLLAIFNAKTTSGKDILHFVLKHWGTKFAFQRTSRGQSALHQAALRGLTEVFQFLQKADAKRLEKELLAGQDRMGQNPLHLAASSHPDVVEELLAIAPALAMQQDHNGETPLHKAVEAGRKSIVETILEKQPTAIELCDKYGRSVYQVARDKLEFRASHEPEASHIDTDLEATLKEWILRRPELQPATVRQLLFQSESPDLARNVARDTDFRRSRYVLDLPFAWASFSPGLQSYPHHASRPRVFLGPAIV
jgi:hypothetical protein